MNTARSSDTESVTVASEDNDSQNKIVTSLHSSAKVYEVEWSNEPLPEYGVVGVRTSRRPSDIPQMDGERGNDTKESSDDSEEAIEQEIVFK